MQTNLTPAALSTDPGREAEAILRSCVHCGFCNATCPTYQLLGDELDGPRGRIYLIKQMLEGRAVTRKTQGHLDRCLTCRACETTCPSGVRYARLADIGRELIEAEVTRPWAERALRSALRAVIPHRRRFTPLLRLGQWLRPLLPGAPGRAVPPRRRAAPWPAARHARHMLALDGCVQPAIAPNIDAAAARVLDRLGISLIRARGGGCCGALSQHLAAPAEARDFARRNIDAWWPHIEQGVEAIVVTASGCGTQVKDYGRLLATDAGYASKAHRVAELARDLSEVLADSDLAPLRAAAPARVAFHSPCSLQHGLRLGGVVEDILTRAGFTLTPVADAHLCCGSAGTYSLLQGRLARELRRLKLAALSAGAPAVIATANIGCLTHLAAGSELPVQHWIELLDAG
ncbi:MAG TPA: glycolate oxidase subunit GlcF [Acidiferrobacterales bacterium]